MKINKIHTYFQARVAIRAELTLVNKTLLEKDGAGGNCSVPCKLIPGLKRPSNQDKNGNFQDGTAAGEPAPGPGVPRAQE